MLLDYYSNASNQDFIDLNIFLNMQSSDIKV